MSKESPVYLHIYWHQHQPWYISPSSDTGLMPWARLHATKDYYDVAYLPRQFEGWKQTINLVPSLLEQVVGYSEGRFTDRSLQLSQKPAAELSPEEKHEILERFFDAHAPRMIYPFPRYHELQRKIGASISERADQFTVQDMRDLQVWFNLVWIDPIWRESPNYPLRDLVDKQRDFTEEDKKAVLDTQKDIISKVVPIHRELHKAGNLELTTSPYFHPILPLLCDSNIAKVSNPYDPVPEPPFQHIEDAEWHIENGLQYFESLMGFRPEGMWPSEGSVSDAACDQMRKAGIRYCATDEEILFRSQPALHSNWQRNDLYKLHRMETPSGEIECIFRDHGLSDLIGFEYQNHDPKEAASEFINHLKTIGKHWTEKTPPLVNVILDGENCWEFYPRDGHDFLKYWIDGILNDEQIIPTTVPEYRKQHPPETTIRSIFPGSWINHNYRIWIGHPEDNNAWSLIREARNKLVEVEDQLTQAQRDEAWRQLYISEGSDWFWWYGDENSSALDALFDELFRSHLARMYECIGIEAPHQLRHSIKSFNPAVVSGGMLYRTPQLREPEGFYDWLGTRHLPAGGGGGAMHSATATRLDIRYGRTDRGLAFRIRTENNEPFSNRTKIKLVFSKPKPISEDIRPAMSSARDTVVMQPDGLDGIIDLASRDIEPEDEIWFHFEFRDGNGDAFSIPHGNELYLDARTAKNSEVIWFL